MTIVTDEQLIRDIQTAGRFDLSDGDQLRLMGSESAWVREALAGNPGLSADLHDTLALDPVPSVREAVARNPGLRAGTQGRLAESAEARVRLALAGNKALVPEVLRTLSTDGLRWVRAATASNPSLPPELQLVLAEDRSWVVRQSLALNPGLTAPAAVVLASDKRSEVRTFLATNPRIPDEVALVLARDPGVHEALAGNPALPGGVQRLIYDRAKPVRPGGAGVDAAATAEYAARPPTGRRDLLRFTLASNPALLPALQHVLARDPEQSVRAELAQNSALLHELQPVLAADPAARVATFMVRRTDLSAAGFRVLLGRLVSGSEHGDWIRTGMRYRPDMGPAELWGVRSLDEPVRGPMIAALTGRARLLRRAVVHTDPLVRLAATRNPALAAAQVQALLADDDPDVRACARIRVLMALGVA